MEDNPMADKPKTGIEGRKRSRLYEKKLKAKSHTN